MNRFSHDNGRPSCTMVVVASGYGRRFGDSTEKKQYHSVAGKPLILHTLSRLAHHPAIDRILPVIAEQDHLFWSTTDSISNFFRETSKIMPPVFGGETRQQSVYKGLAALNLPPDQWVGIHDGVRPLIDRPFLDRLFEARHQSDAIIPGLPVTDTLKQTDNDGQVVKTVDRCCLWRVQTPQIFRYGLISEAHLQALHTGLVGTDDASLVESLGAPILMIHGDPNNLKLTYPEELSLIQQRLSEKTS